MTDSSRAAPLIFSAPTMVQAEGARIALFTCMWCGAVVMVDPRDDKDFLRLHRDWHNVVMERGQAEPGEHDASGDDVSRG